MRKQWNSKQRFSLRKFSTGLASVLLATMFMSQGVMAQTNEVSEKTNDTEVVNSTEENTVTNVQPKAPAGVANGKVEASEQPAIAAEKPQPTTTLEKEKIEEPKVAINTTKLESLIKEVEGLDLEKYTEESVKGLNVRLAKVKDALVNAKSQKEIDSAYNALVGYKNSGLKRVPKLEENNTPKPDTTGGKETVGKKAENTEPNGTNIAGHNHSLNGTTRAAGSGFRATPEEISGIEFGISNNRTDGKYSSVDKYFYEISSNQVRTIVKIVSKSGKINEVTATSNTGRTVTLEKMTKFPNNETTYFVKATTDVNGKNDAVLTFTVKTVGGDKTVQIGAFRSFSKPTIKVPTGQTESTVDDYLKGKDGTKPTIDVEVPSVPSLPSYAKMKVYLVADNDRDKTVYDGDEFATNGNPRPTRLTAKVDVSTGTVDPATKKTTVTIRESDYLKPLSGGKLLALTVVEIDDQTNGNPGIRASSYSDAVTVAPKVNLEEVKRQAKAELGRIAQAEIDAINADSSLTTTEKTAKVQDVNTKKTQGEQAIDATTADNADKVAEAKETAKTEIEGVHTPGNLATVKSNAKAELGRIAQAEIDAINADSSLTTTEKTAKVQDVNTKKTQGEQAIDATTADNADKVAEAKETAKTEIEGVHTPGNLADVKRQAKEELATFLQGELEKGRSLIEKEKDTLISAVNDNLQKENKKIDDAQNADEVEKAKLAGIKVIPSVISLNEAAILEKREITSDKNSSLTTEYRGKKLTEVEETLKAELAKIDQLTTIDTIKKSTEKGVKAIEAIHKPLSSNAHEVAILTLPELDLQTALVAGTATVKQGQELTDDDITNQLALPEEVKVLSVTKPSTDKAGNFVATVKLQLANGKTKTINVPVSIYSQTPPKVDDLSKAKEEAIEKVEKAVKDKLQEIEKQPDLTEAERKAAKNEVNKAKDSAWKAIAQASSLGTVEFLGEEYAKNIAVFTPEHGKDIPEVKAPDVSELDKAKAEGIAAVLQAEVDKLELMNKDSVLTPSEKAEVNAEIARIRSKAIADIRQATDVKGVENITNVAVEAILNARPRYNYNSNDNANHSSTTNTNRPQSDNDMMKALLAKKSEAKMLIEQEAMKKKAEISQADLFESEKALLDARVDQEKAKAFQMIDQATTIEEVDQALKAGIEAIRSIAVASANGRMTDVTSEESEAAMAQAHRQALPQTGTGNEVAIFGAAASAILAGLGLVVPSKKKED